MGYEWLALAAAMSVWLYCYRKNRQHAIDNHLHLRRELIIVFPIAIKHLEILIIRRCAIAKVLNKSSKQTPSNKRVGKD
ncbi:MAG: hypothetical protein V7735_18330 [Photobacterium frigidiphilum]|uniref:hypothetical protein n=1 Tax=Photobacterium frigidiphilum TaxID=264736 RepID=UPI003002C04C